MINPRGPPELAVIGRGVVAPVGLVGLTAVARGADPAVPFSKSTFRAGVAETATAVFARTNIARRRITGFQAGRLTQELCTQGIVIDGLLIIKLIVTKTCIDRDL